MMKILQGGNRMSKQRYVLILVLVMIAWLVGFSSASAQDSELSRKTLAGLPGVYVVVEELQPNITKYDKYLKKAGLSRARLQENVEKRLRSAGIRPLAREEWLKTRGRPVLYLNVNSHENEKYWFAYDVKLEFQQVVCMEANPSIKTLADTWSLNSTGVVNIGNLDGIYKETERLIDRFIAAWQKK